MKEHTLLKCQRLFRPQIRKLRQVLFLKPDLSASYHSREDIHEHSDINEMSFQTDVGNITDPDLIASVDVKYHRK